MVDPGSQVAGPPVADDRVADDGFWADVAARLLGRDADLVLLETWSATTSRWHLIGTGTRLETVRARLKPGALLTVYPEPPRPPDDTLARRAGQLLAPSTSDPGLDNEVLGLIQEPESGGLRFARLRTAEEVAGWLSRAERARTCGLYPSNPAPQPGLLQAVVPQAQPAPAPPAPTLANDAAVKRHLARSVLGLVVLLALTAVCGYTWNTLFTEHDRPAPALAGLETRAGCGIRGSTGHDSGTVESGNCQIDGTTVMFATFHNDTDRHDWIVLLELAGAQYFAFGPGWAIESEDRGVAAQVATALGGQVTRSNLDFQVSPPSG